MIRIGIDFGGTKLEAVAMGPDGAIISRVRRPNPGDYEASIALVKSLVESVEREAGDRAQGIGIGSPGSASPRAGLMRNANSTWLNGRPFREDLEAALDRPVRLENDANCFALSEASDGAGAGAAVVFGVIIGTGCGGGLVVNGQVVTGVNGVAGEWGHIPLPWPNAQDLPARPCWCGRPNCLETWISGSGFSADHAAATGESLKGEAIVKAALSGDLAAAASLDRYIDRLGRGLAVICDIVDPDVIVLGGGMSNVDLLYERVPAIAARWVFSDVFETRIVKAVHGDSSGVRGAAWLWPLQ